MAFSVTPYQPVTFSADLTGEDPLALDLDGNPLKRALRGPSNKGALRNLCEQMFCEGSMGQKISFAPTNLACDAVTQVFNATVPTLAQAKDMGRKAKGFEFFLLDQLSKPPQDPVQILHPLRTDDRLASEMFRNTFCPTLPSFSEKPGHTEGHKPDLVDGVAKAAFVPIGHAFEHALGARYGLGFEFVANSLHDIINHWDQPGSIGKGTLSGSIHAAAGAGACAVMKRLWGVNPAMAALSAALVLDPVAERVERYLANLPKEDFLSIEQAWNENATVDGGPLFSQARNSLKTVQAPGKAFHEVCHLLSVVVTKLLPDSKTIKEAWADRPEIHCLATEYTIGVTPKVPLENPPA